MPTPTTLTTAEYSALTVDAINAQTAAIKDNTTAMAASREAVVAMHAMLAAKPLGISEQFVLDVLGLVLAKPAA